MSLPVHGRVACNRCHPNFAGGFDTSITQSGDWRIVHNPLAWGNPNAEIAVLGFSKGPTQRGAIAASEHDEIAFKGGRSALAKILHHIGLIEQPSANLVDSLISDHHGRFHFGSLVRCTVERRDSVTSAWTGTGGGMLDRFAATSFGRQIVSNCIDQHLVGLSPKTKLIVMLGLGTAGNYVRECRKAFASGRANNSWRTINEVAYSDGDVTVVHVEHFKSQGALLPNWLSEHGHPRGKMGLLARQAVAGVIG
jgi:hypothetical protein